MFNLAKKCLILARGEWVLGGFEPLSAAVSCLESSMRLGRLSVHAGTQQILVSRANCMSKLHVCTCEGSAGTRR